MVQIARDCYHLEAPNLIPLSVERFSPYHDDPSAHGIEIVGANRHYRYAYPLDAKELLDIAYVFEHRVSPVPDLEPGLRTLRAAVDEWQAAQQAAGLQMLALKRGPGFAVIEDRRYGRAPSDYRLGRIEAMIYDLCDTGIGLPALRSSLAKHDVPIPSDRAIEAFLNALLDAGLVFREGKRYLSLAVEALPRDSRETANDASVRVGVALSEIEVALRTQ
jgi:hypothetical protein